MRIYLDSCVFQDLKEDKYSDLLALIKSGKGKNIYCFSEAHLHDLSRDKGSEKYNDMKFIEEIADNNCYYYNKKILFEYLTPTEYYNSYDWSHVTELFSDEDPFSSMLKSLFQKIPLNFGDFISKDKLPPDYPPEFTELLTRPTNFYDFTIGLLAFTEDLSNEQKKFREFVKYLHKNSLTANIYESIGIKGFNGKNIIDKQVFRESYTKYFLKDGKGKYRYNLFIDMYNGLEFFGFVKGKPRKQKMISMINDGRHAFFGAFCDIIVSTDKDFLKKTKFIYDFSEVETLTFNISEFDEYLQNNKYENLKLKELLSEYKNTESNTIDHQLEDGDSTFSSRFLKNTYYGYFDTITIASVSSKNFFFFSRRINNFSNGTLTKEIEYVTNKLIFELGEDYNKNGLFQSSEINENEWCGRNWVISEVLIELKCINKMFLRFYPLYNDEETSN